MSNIYFEKQPNGYLKYIGDKPKDTQLNLFSDCRRYQYYCRDCGESFENTYATHTHCLRCKSENIYKK